MNEIAAHKAPRRPETIDQEIAEWLRWLDALMKPVIDAVNCRLEPLIVVEGVLAPQEVPEIPSELRAEITRVHETIARLRQELWHSVQRERAQQRERLELSSQDGRSLCRP